MFSLAVPNPQATWREHQREAVDNLVKTHGRVLCVQRTGWGKSAVYFVATALLREEGSGPTIIISPLLSLMRNQIDAASRLGLRAMTVNSANREGWADVEQALEDDSVDLLLVSPERLGNERFISDMLPLFIKRVGLLVIDEAHCISDWGHDFRPDYGRLTSIIKQLPDDVAILCTTATANDRVVADIERSLGESNLHTYRGALARASLHVDVLSMPQAAERLVWLSTHLPAFEGSGIVYCLTKRDTENVATWLNSQGITARAYSGEHTDADRQEIEALLLNNKVKTVVATSALGMGYDKPDLGFVVHYQSPGSPIAYYQQVGRAGRGVERAHVVLLHGREDTRIQDWFIDSAFPAPELVEQILHILLEPTSIPGLQTQINLGKGRLEGLLKRLQVEGAVTRSGAQWTRSSAPYHIDAERQNAITTLRKQEQQVMDNLGRDKHCIMMRLQQELDDPKPTQCGQCSICRDALFTEALNEALIAEAEALVRDQTIPLLARKQAPATVEGKGKRIPAEFQLCEGRALARNGDDGWSPIIGEGIAAGKIPDDVIDALAALVKKWGIKVDYVCAVPSCKNGNPVSDAGGRLAHALDVTWSDCIQRSKDSPPQKSMTNSSQQYSNVRGHFTVADVSTGNCLLFDDIRYSGWTQTLIGAQILQAGASQVFPLAMLLAGAS